MSEPIDVRPSIGPLSVGNVINASLRLYRDRFKTYFGIAFRASLWLLFPFILLFLMMLIVGIVTTAQGNNSLALLWLFIPAWLLSLIYCLAKSFVNSALISRLTFYELSNQPETVHQGYLAIYRQLWWFWLTQFIMFWMFFVLSLLLSFVQTFLINYPATLLNNSVLTFILFLLGFVIYYTVYLWFYARFFISEVPLSIESNLNAFDTIGRSWHLTKGYAGKIIGIISLAIMITLPVYIIVLIPAWIGLIASLKDLSTSTMYSWSGTKIVLGFFGSFLLFILMNIAVIPLWQVTKGVIYYDLLIRKEGFDLTLRDSNGI